MPPATNRKRGLNATPRTFVAAFPRLVGPHDHSWAPAPPGPEAEDYG
jgi:hypothetical protein